MRVLVAGGSGVIGSYLVPLLVARGHEVSATTTKEDRLGELRQLGATGVVMDGLDPISVGEVVAIARPDVIVNQMTALSHRHAGKLDVRRPERFFHKTNQLRSEGVGHLLSAAQAAEARVVVQSHASFNGRWVGGWVKAEDEPLEVTGTTWAIADMERSVVHAGGCVLRYGALYGSGANHDQIALVRTRRIPLVGGGRGHISWVHAYDAATATIKAIEQETTGVFNIVDDDPAPASEWLPRFAYSVGAKPPLRVPVWLGRRVAGDMVTDMMLEGRGFSNRKAKQELGWKLQFPSWRSGFMENLA